jgi:hypothetical protein
MANEVFEGASYIWKLKKKIRDNKYWTWTFFKKKGVQKTCLKIT